MTANVASPLNLHSSSQKLFLNPWFWVISITILFAYPIFRTLNRKLPAPLPEYSQLPNYELTNQFGKPFGAQNLKGRVYIANFFFTSCSTMCPPLMEKMRVMQKRVRGLGQKVALVSFTVDPQTDDAQKLLKYSRKLQSNPFIWTYLTGERDVVSKLLVKDFKVPMGEQTSESNLYDIAHSGKFVLVDGDGTIRGYYSSDKDSINKLMIDVGLLVNRRLFEPGKKKG